MILATDIVDWNALGQVVLYSFLAGVGVPAIFAMAVYGAARSTDPHRRSGGPSAAAYAILALIGAAICVAAIAYGIWLMTQK